MDCYNDMMCETVSGFSWPSWSLTTVYSDQLVRQFAQDWDYNISHFKPTSVETHYRDTNVCYEIIISCIAEVWKNNLFDELNVCEAVGIQIDGSCDRQQLWIKFVTARLFQNRTISTRFISAIEPCETGANCLLEALGRSLKRPRDVTSHTLQFNFNDNMDINGDYAEMPGSCNNLLLDTMTPDFKATVFGKLYHLPQTVKLRKQARRHGCGESWIINWIGSFSSFGLSVIGPIFDFMIL